MAVIRNGALFAWISGKLGDNVFKVWKNKQVAQAYNAAPFKAPPTDDMTLMRTLMEYASQAWSLLSQGEQDLWYAVAGQHTTHTDSSPSFVGGNTLVQRRKNYTQARNLFIQRYINMVRHGGWNPKVWDKLKQEWDALTGWTEEGAGTSEISPAGQLHLLPNASNYIGRFRDIGTLPNDYYTLEFKIYFDSLGTIASGNYFRIDLFNGVYFCSFLIGTDALQSRNSGVGYDSFSMTNLADTWYYYRFVVDSTVPSVKAYRSTDGYNWAYLTEFTDLYVSGSNNGLISAYQFRGAAGDSECHMDYLYVATGLFNPNTFTTVPVKSDLPYPPEALSASYAAGTLTITWTDPYNWNEDTQRIGFMVEGGKTSLGKIYKQFLGYQSDPTANSYATAQVKVAGATLKDLTDLEDTWVKVQAYTVNIVNGLMSSGTLTIKILIE